MLGMCRGIPQTCAHDHLSPRKTSYCSLFGGILGNGIESFGLRDDAGVLPTPDGGSLVVSVDSVVDGIHVDLSLCAARLTWGGRRSCRP